MIKLFLLCFIIFAGYYCIKNKIKVKFKTFLKKGFKINKGIYGIYCYCGFQGNGKTSKIYVTPLDVGIVDTNSQD